jgi:hypothetical protein
MTDRPKGIWEDIWDDSIKWVRRLPLYFRLTHLPIIGKYLFRDTYVGDPNTKAWMLPVHEDIDQPPSAHLPMDVVRPLIMKAASRAKSARCICRVGFECQDYPHEDACVFLGSAFNNPDELGLVPLTVEEAVTHVERGRSCPFSVLVRKLDLLSACAATAAAITAWDSAWVRMIFEAGFSGPKACPWWWETIARFAGIAPNRRCAA